MKKNVLIKLTLSLLLLGSCFVSCGNNNSSEAPSSSELSSEPSSSSVESSKESSNEVIDNTEGSLNHDPIYIYRPNNVPYDSDGETRDYIFLTPYLASKPTGGAVIVCPGGAYKHLSNSTDVDGDEFGQGVNNLGNQKESSSIASFYNEQGISVFILNYRTKALDSNINYQRILSDGTRAVKYVRYFAENYFVDPDKIAIQGYSAGGHLASMVLTRYDFEIDDPNYTKDAIDEVSAEPNASVLCYAVITLSGDGAHSTTRKNFISDESKYEYYSADKAVTSETAPTFLWCHQNDKSVNAEINTKAMAKALEEKGVKHEVHVYDDNGTRDHGIGIAQDYEEAKEWPTLATSFLKSCGF